MTGPLAGIRVIEVGHMLMGPYCGMLLADLGAEIVKVESSDGDIARSIGTHYIGPHNAYFASLNRGKKSVVLDLGTECGQQALGELVAGARALLTNLRPSAIRKLGLTFDSLKRWNPSLVCVALTGYGLDGPNTDRPAYDYAIQAMTGVMQLTGDPEGPPTRTGFSVVDNSTAIMGALGLVARLLSGHGGQVDVSMYDAMLSQLNYLAGAWLNAGELPVRQAESSHPYIVPAQNFRTGDGWITLFITHDDFWRRFCRAVDRREWITDATFATMAARVEHRAAVVSAISVVLREATTQHWLDRLLPLGVVVAGVESLADALASENVRARNMVIDMWTPEGVIRAVGNPIKNSGVVESFIRPPLLGEHDGHLTNGASL